MSDSSLAPRDPNVLTKTQARRLEQDQFIAWLVQSDASDARCYFELARYATRRHEKAEMIAGAVVGFVSGLILGGGSWPGSLAVGIAAFFVTVLLIFLIHWILAPSTFYKQALAELRSTKLLLLQEQARNAAPHLTGEIICLEDDARLDQVDQDYDCFITLCVRVWNSGTPTAVDTFSLDLWREEVDHPGTHEPVNEYYVETFGREPGDERSKHAIRTTDLTEFPTGEEIATTSKTGWRRFSFGSLPPEMIESGHRAVGSSQLAKDVIIELTAFDSQQRPHTIYKGKMYEGVRRLIGGCGKIKKSTANDFMFA